MVVMNRGGLRGRANSCNSKGQEHSQLQEPEQHCCCRCVSNSTHGQGSPALALVIDGKETGVFPTVIFLLLMYEIKYETMNPIEQIWEESHWTFFLLYLEESLKKI